MSLKLYFANDDSLISSIGELANAVELILRADLNEENEVRLYALNDTGYQTTETELSLVDSDYRYDPGTGIRSKDEHDDPATLTMWALALDIYDESGVYEDWGADLELGTVGDTDKVYFWAKAKAIDTEDVKKDVSVALKAEGISGVI